MRFCLGAGLKLDQHLCLEPGSRWPRRSNEQRGRGPLRWSAPKRAGRPQISASFRCDLWSALRVRTQGPQSAGWSAPRSAR